MKSTVNPAQFATPALALVTVLKNVDLPVFGWPMNAIRWIWFLARIDKVGFVLIMVLVEFVFVLNASAFQ
jgi:hypothetical protein